MKCPYCGAENPVGAAFCGSCGKPISNNASIPQAPNQYQNPTVNQNQGGSYSGSISNQFSPPPPPQPGAILNLMPIYIQIRKRCRGRAPMIRKWHNCKIWKLIQKTLGMHLPPVWYSFSS